MANQRSGDVSVIDSSTNTVIVTVGVGNGPLSLEYNPCNNNIYVSNSHSDDVSVIQTVMPPPNEESRTIDYFIKGIIQNPLDATNSIDSANEMRYFNRQ